MKPIKLLTHSEDSAPFKTIQQGVIDFNKPFFGEQRLESFTLYIENEIGETIAGINGQIAFDGHFALVTWSWVHEQYRHQGLGTKLFKKLEEYAKAKGCTTIQLETWDFQARPFYEKLGYVCVGTIPQWIDGRDNYFMKKQL